MKKVLVLCGGQSSEHLISRMSTTSVMRHINKDKYELTLVGIDKAGIWYELNQFQEDYAQDNWLEGSHVIDCVFEYLKHFDVVFPVMHGKFGEDGTLQGMLEMVNVPYVGCRVLSSSVSMDKVYTKKILQSAHIPLVKSIYVKKRYDGTLVCVLDTFEETTDIEGLVEKEIGYPCFIKASNSGSSVGCYKVDCQDKLMETLQEAASYDRKVLIEKCIDCIELEVAVLGNDDLIVSRVGQIIPHGEFYTFESKYDDEESKTCIPALVDNEIQEKIRELAARVFKAVDGHGLSRVDFFLDKKSNEVYLNEINTLPGFTSISMYPQLIGDLGISYSELIDRLIELAYERESN